MDAFLAVMPTREKYSKNVAAWITEGPNPNEVCHLLAYPSLEARMEARAGVAKEAACTDFAESAGAHVVEMTSTRLMQSSVSPPK